jgi:hypothetical protein
LSLYLPIVDLFLEDLFLEGWGKRGGGGPPTTKKIIKPFGYTPNSHGAMGLFASSIANQSMSFVII